MAVNRPVESSDALHGADALQGNNCQEPQGLHLHRNPAPACFPVRLKDLLEENTLQVRWTTALKISALGFLPLTTGSTRQPPVATLQRAIAGLGCSLVTERH